MSEDINAEVIKKTQKILGKYVKKPPLTEKLLKKPPFRFLHDIVNAIISETGFLKELFSEEELKTENVKEKDAKIAFLNKLIDAVKVTTKTDLSVRSSKIVAGLEPTKTNLLLQAIGKAIDAQIDASEYIAQLNSGKIDTTENKTKKTNSSTDTKIKSNSKTKLIKDETKVTKSKKTIGESPRSKVKDSTPKESSRSKTKTDKIIKKEIKSKTKAKEEQLKENDDSVTKITAEVEEPKVHVNTADMSDHKETINSNKINDEVKNMANEDEKVARPPEAVNRAIKSGSVDKEEKPESVENKNIQIENTQLENPQMEDGKNSGQTLKRPKSARPKSGDKRIVSSKQRNPNIHQEEILKPLEMTVNQPARPKSSLRPPSVRPSSARPGAPRLRPDSALPLQEPIAMGSINVIIENMDSADDEETVIIQTTSEMGEENTSPIEIPQDNKGQLVEQILEQIQEEDGVKKKVDIDWEQDVLHNKDGSSREINQLRSLIQTLTKTANPLGKLLNYLHEDIDAMHVELQMWTSIKKQLFSEIQKQKRLTAELNKPLLAHLEHLREEIKKQEQEITNVRSNILRNELRIKELLM